MKEYKKFRDSKYIAKFAKLVRAQNLWFFNRKSVISAISLGVTCAWIPLPFHTIIAVSLAVIIDCNIPLVVTSIWVANPITMPLMYYTAYRVGEYLLGIPTQDIHFHLSIHDMISALHEIWQPFLLGCLICGLASGLITNIVIRLIWNSKKFQRSLKREACSR